MSHARRTHTNAPDHSRPLLLVRLQDAQSEILPRLVVLKAHEEKKAIIIKAMGETESAKMVGAAVKNNPGFIEMRRIEVAKEIATGLSKSNNRLVLSADSLLLNLMDPLKDGTPGSVNKKGSASWGGA